MKFCKNNAQDIVRMLVYQFGMTIFSLVLYFAVGMVQDADPNDTSCIWEVLISVFATAFYFILVFLSAWETGARDRIKVDAGRESKVPFKGALIAGVANIPNFIVSIMGIIAYSFVLAEVGGNAVAAVSLLLLKYGASMYLGIGIGLVTLFGLGTSSMISFFVQVLIFLGGAVLCCLVSAAGYGAGYRNLHLLPRKKNN